MKTFFLFNNLFSKIFSEWDNVEKCGRAVYAAENHAHCHDGYLKLQT